MTAGGMRQDPKRVMPRSLFLALNRLKNAGEIKVVIVVIDNTVGWQRESAEISLSTFCAATGLSRFGVLKTIRSLERQHVIRMISRGTSWKKSNVYMLNPLSYWKVDVVSQKARQPQSRAKLTSDRAQSLPVEGAKLTSTGQLAKPEAGCIKKERNPLRKEKERDGEGGTQGAAPPETPALLKGEENEEDQEVGNQTLANGRNLTPEQALDPPAKQILRLVCQTLPRSPATAILRNGVELEILSDLTRPAASVRRAAVKPVNALFHDKLTQNMSPADIADAFERVLGGHWEVTVVRPPDDEKKRNYERRREQLLSGHSLEGGQYR
jgi:hypothetical protein